jgi:hypothetical protein
MEGAKRQCRGRVYIYTSKHFTPCPQKGEQKNPEIFLIAFEPRGTKHYAQLKSKKKILRGFLFAFLGTGRDLEECFPP